MNQLIFLCLIGAAWAMHTGNAEVAGVQPSTPSYTPGYKPVYNLVLSRSAPTFGSGHKVAGTSVPFFPYVFTSVPVAGVADTGSYPYVPFPYPYRTTQATTTAAADCPYWAFC